MRFRLLYLTLNPLSYRIICHICGGAGHIANDCKMKRPGDLRDERFGGGGGWGGGGGGGGGFGGRGGGRGGVAHHEKYVSRR